MGTDAEDEAPSDFNAVYQDMVEIFEASIQEADLTDLIKKLHVLYDSFSDQGFEQSFKHILRISMTESKRSTDVRKMFCFIAEGIVTLDNKFKAANKVDESMEDTEDIMHPLLKGIFTILQRWSKAASFPVRYRSCQLLYMILTYIQDHGIGEIDMVTFETISTVIEERRLDVSCNVRAHAVLLAKFFQDPSTVDDPVIAGLCWQLQNDPNARVRQNIVSIIAACEETIIPITKRFLFDVNANVRNAALLHICNRISPRSFTASQRILILNQCFSDPSALVRRNAEVRLIPVWFRAYKDKLCRFFKDLQRGSDSLDNLVFITPLLQVLSRCVKIAHIIEEIDLDIETHLPKSELSGEKIFLWRNFYKFAQKDERLSAFLPETSVLIDFILNYFSNSNVGDEKAWIFNELILFLMDILDVTGIENGQKIFPVVLDLMKNPFVSHEVMPYLVPLYLNYVQKEKEFVHDDILEIIEILQKMVQFTPMGEEKNILLKCFAIASQLLIEENIITNGIRNIKDKLIIHYLSDEDEELKNQAIIAFSLYCEMDIKEAKLSWPLFSNGFYIGVSPMKCTLLKSAFDILKSHGREIFSDLTNDGDGLLNDALESILSHSEDDEDERKIIVQGILKLFLVHHTWSPSILSKLVVLYFHPDQYYSTRKDLEDFFEIYGETREEAECLNKALLSVINILFDSNKNNPYHKVSVKNSALQLIEFSKGWEKSDNFTLEEKFQDLIVLKLCKKFLKMPWRMSASDLYSICSSFIPKKYEQLLKLKEHVKMIIESLQSPIFQQKNPYSKRSLKQFASYMKKIQVAMDTAPLFEEAPKQTTPLNTTLTKVNSPLEKRLFGNSYTEDSLSSKETEITEDNSPPETPTETRTSVSGTPLPAKTPSFSKTPLPAKTPSLSKTPLPAKAASTLKTPRNISRVETHSSTETPFKTPRQPKTPGAFKTPRPVKTPLPVSTSSVKKTKNASAAKKRSRDDVHAEEELIFSD